MNLGLQRPGKFEDQEVFGIAADLERGGLRADRLQLGDRDGDGRAAEHSPKEVSAVQHGLSPGQRGSIRRWTSTTLDYDKKASRPNEHRKCWPREAQHAICQCRCKLNFTFVNRGSRAPIRARPTGKGRALGSSGDEGDISRFFAVRRSAEKCAEVGISALSGFLTGLGGVAV